jgi:predicted dehydrogenase
MNKTTRIGIIGVGQVGKYHLDAYQEIEDAEVVAIADIDEEEATRVSQVYGVPHVYTDFRELLRRDDVEAVDVCVHNNLHMPVTVAALEAGKHVFCEKPMAGTYRDAEVMHQTAQELERKLSIQIRNLFFKETKAAKTLIDEGLLGHLYYARSAGARRRGRPYVDGYGSPPFVQKRHAGGGAMYDVAIYHVANVLYLLGNPEVLRISGKIYQETAMDPARRESSGYDVEELGLGFVRLQGGVTLEVAEAWAIHLDRFGGSYVVGSEGGVRLEPFGFYRSIGDLDVDSTANLEAFEWRLHALREDADAYDGPHHHWVAALQGRVELLPTAELALNTMLIAEGVYLSDSLGREVTADEVRASSHSTAVRL